jgi:hypothetical protein
MMHVKPDAFFADRMFKVANAIQPLGGGQFDMSQWTRWECGSPSCMAGHAVWIEMFNRDVIEMLKEDDFLDALKAYRRVTDCGFGTHVKERAQAFFGIDPDTAQVLFVPAHCNLHMGRTEPVWHDQCADDDVVRQRITGRWAANTLRHLAVEGVVDWTRMKEPA